MGAGSRAAGDPISDFAGVHPGDRRVLEGVALRWCPAGTYRMGSPSGESGRRPDEAQVDVTLTRGFWIGAFEVTQGEWERFVGAFPERVPTARFGLGDEHPVYWVNFSDAEEVCARLTARGRASGALPEGWEARLPTEAQWEYACRAGSTSATAFGDTLELEEANFALNPVPAGQAARATGSSTPVDRYPPNVWGIHDMHGNVWEWCRDWYHSRLPGGTDPDLYARVGVPNRDGSYSRVRRGGAWIEGAELCRSAARLRFEPYLRSDHIGFRVVVVQVA